MRLRLVMNTKAIYLISSVSLLKEKMQGVLHHH